MDEKIAAGSVPVQNYAHENNQTEIHHAPAAGSSTASQEEHVGKYVASDRDVEAGLGGEQEPMSKLEQERMMLEAEIGSPVHTQSPFMDKVSMLLHSKGAVVARDFGLILLILGIWIPSIVREEHRGLWVVTTIWAWFFILLILFHKSKYIPQRPFIRVIETTWNAVLGKPWSMIPYAGKLAIGWASLLVLFLGSAFGIPENSESTYERRGVALCGIAITYGFLFAISTNHGAVKARTTIVGLGLQMIFGLFVYKTSAGYDLFSWIATAATDLLEQGQLGGAAFFWSTAFLDNHFFFVNILASIIFFVALATALFYVGALGWVIRKFAWFFHKLFAISGAEAVVAAASPFIGQGENCVLTRPFVGKFTDSEFHQVLVSGFATIAGSVFIAYVQLGIDGRDLLLSSVMSIPGSIAAAKIVVPETQKPKTLGRVAMVDRSKSNKDNLDEDEDRSVNTLHALSNGAWFGVRVAALIFANVLVIVSTLYLVNGLLSWIGQFWGLTRYGEGANPLSLQLIGSYLLFPFVYLMGVQRSECLKVSALLSTKIVANEYVAYSMLSGSMKDDPTYLSKHSFRVASLLLCGFGNISSAGINIGILTAMAPKRAETIIKMTPRALLTGILVTSMTAAIGGMVG